ncbi:MAG: recombinase family protein [Patescibacteria group bacterium]
MKNNKYQNDYLIYTRKSTDDADNQKNSIDYQIGQCSKYASDHKLDIAQLDQEGFCEAGTIKEKHTAFKTSGIQMKKDGTVEYKIERPKFQVMVQKLLDKEFKGIICLCWDRISRNEQDGLIIKNLMDKGVDIRFVQANYEKSSSGALHRDIDGMFSAHYSRVISEKVKAAAEKLRAEGKCIYMSPIGYLDEGSGSKPIDPERASIVKRIFELYSSGEWSLFQLAKWANTQGLTTKPARRNRTKAEMLAGIEVNTIPKASRPVNNKTIENILNNPFYIGKIKIGRKEKYIDGAHQPLIDTSLFNQVQQVLKSKNVCIHYIDKDFFTYRNIIKCPCGRSYSPYQRKGINYYYSRCKDGCHNQSKSITEKAIDGLVERVLEKISFTDAEKQEIEARANFELDKITSGREKELDDFNQERKRIYADLNYITKNKISLLRANTMSIDEIAKEEKRLNEELQVIENKTHAHQEAANEMLKYVITFSELVKMANVYYKHALDIEKREIATQVFSELFIANKELADIKAKEGFQALFARHDLISGSEVGIYLEPN